MTELLISNEVNLYNFPYDPYPQQIGLMNEIFKTIDQKKCGVFESPTGTGKSLSILCSTLNWIFKNEDEEHQRLIQMKQKLQDAEERTKSEFNWIKAFDDKRKLNLETIEEINKLEKRGKILKEIKEIRLKRKREDPISQFINDSSKEDEWIVDYDSDDSIVDEFDGEKSAGIVKIYYCSRTHSQLAQVVKELRKTSYSTKIVVSTMGSRQNLCVNTDVNALKSINLINEKCLDLQKPGEVSKKQKSSSRTCNFKNSTKIAEMSAAIVTKTMDIEDLVAKGLKICACPFYGVRQTLNKSHLVLLPYQNLLNPAARVASGLNLTDNVVIIDEAHNLADTISSINSVTITLDNVQTCRQQIEGYLNKYLNRLSNKNLLYIRQIVSILKNLERFMKCSLTTSFNCTDFLFKSYINNFKLDQILKYLERSKLAFKLRGFLKSTVEDKSVVRNRNFSDLFNNKENVENGEEAAQVMNTGNSMLVFKNFLAAIVYGLDAKILVVPGISLRFLVVNPGKYLTDIVTQCRSLVVIGGTMQPFNEFIERLFKVAGCKEDRIVSFSCDHVVEAKKQMRVISLGRGPGREELKFNFESRTNTAMIIETGKVIHAALGCCPSGAIIFFASYEAMQTMLSEWKKSQLFVSIERLKSTFVEPKQSSQLDPVMRSFSSMAKSTRGAVLFAVIGGKMSEGINFDDELARLVVVIGVPYPQIKDPVLQEKRRFVELEYGPEAASVMYHNLAMRAVNQAIGRAIRHKCDYAAVVLLDCRYDLISRIGDSEHGRLGLPRWMKEAVSNHDSLATVLDCLTYFFKEKGA